MTIERKGIIYIYYYKQMVYMGDFDDDFQRQALAGLDWAG